MCCWQAGLFLSPIKRAVLEVVWTSRIWRQDGNPAEDNLDLHVLKDFQSKWRVDSPEQVLGCLSEPRNKTGNMSVIYLYELQGTAGKRFPASLSETDKRGSTRRRMRCYILATLQRVPKSHDNCITWANFPVLTSLFSPISTLWDSKEAK